MERKRVTRLLTTLLLGISALRSATAQNVGLPSAPGSVKFAAIGDTGSGDPEQYDVANQMARLHALAGATTNPNEASKKVKLKMHLMRG
jgi:hypothetical protein